VDFISSKCSEVANEQVIDQCLHVLSSQKYSKYQAGKYAVSLLLCLSRCWEAHENLLKPSVIEKVLTWYETDKEEDNYKALTTR